MHLSKFNIQCHLKTLNYINTVYFIWFVEHICVYLPNFILLNYIILTKTNEKKKTKKVILCGMENLNVVHFVNKSAGIAVQVAYLIYIYI